MKREIRFFASDNCSKVYPTILEALEEENFGHSLGYGYDRTTYLAIKLIKKVMRLDCIPFFVYNGTGANILAISSLLKPYESVFTVKSAHINHHETGGLERFAGNKIIYDVSEDGKIKLEYIINNLKEIGDEHVAQIKIVSISQPTELGTVYSLNELEKLKTFCFENNLFLHIDGARIFNACDFLKVKIDEIFKYCDVLSFGGTKNGLMFGEVVVFNMVNLKQKEKTFKSKIINNLIKDFKFVRKQGMQLHSKMRFISAQYLRYLNSDLPYELAKNSNDLALYFENKINEFRFKFEEFLNNNRDNRSEFIKNINNKNSDKYFKLYKKRETNQIFVFFPLIYYKKLSKKFPFYIWDEKEEIVRFVTSWDNTKDDIDKFLNYLESIVFNKSKNS
ncbi:MAG: aminotransferase class I/II-fold pyridoxal phosphate-dependent enzyme [Spirochaetes bacterium]|nr:aminotransferase class I/II-fold pyridoxal phosphate-dependent enzyme [Spirochaetota bacterium]